VLEPFAMDKFFVRDENFIYRLTFAVVNFISWSVYNPLSLLLVHKHRILLQNEQSNIEKNDNLGWVLSVSIFYVVYCILAVILGVTVYFVDINPQTPHIYNYAVLLFLIYILSFYGLRQRIPFLSVESENETTRQSNLSDETKELIKQKILTFFEEEKAYLQPELSMDLLTSHLKIPKYQITEVLNSDLGMNFFRFVNSYRIEAVKEMLANPNLKYSIEAIGYECGFSSKSAFYSCFKKMTGETPVTYRNALLHL
jgi:AraC-like DNA-binding protein